MWDGRNAVLRPRRECGAPPANVQDRWFVFQNEVFATDVANVTNRRYFPPEMLLGFDGYECAADWWALGCAVAEVFVG